MLNGGSGTNTLNGGPGRDTIQSVSGTDTVTTGVGPDAVSDALSLHMGGRTYSGLSTGGHSWGLNTQRGDSRLRVRPLAGNTALVTAALARNGEQELASGFWQLYYYFATSAVTDRVVLDTVPLPNKAQQMFGSGREVVDITVPTGTWTVVGDPATNATVTFSNGSQPISVQKAAHSRCTHPSPTNRRFAHRVIHDLQMRIAPNRSAISSEMRSQPEPRPGGPRPTS